MSKLMYLITFLSVVLFNSESSFGQELKKELGICGKSMSAIFKIAQKAPPVLDGAFMKEDEFCDKGRYEENANFIIRLYNAEDKLVYDKRVYLNPMVFHEGFTDKKDPGAIKKTKITQDANSRIVKFPVSKEMGTITKYKIESLEDKKTYEMQKLKW